MVYNAPLPNNPRRVAYPPPVTKEQRPKALRLLNTSTLQLYKLAHTTPLHHKLLLTTTCPQMQSTPDKEVQKVTPTTMGKGEQKLVEL